MKPQPLRLPLTRPSSPAGLSVSRPRVVTQLERGNEPWVLSGADVTLAWDAQRRPHHGEWGSGCELEASL